MILRSEGVLPRAKMLVYEQVLFLALAGLAGLLLTASMLGVTLVPFRHAVLLASLVGFVLLVAGIFDARMGIYGVVITCTLDPFYRCYASGGPLLRWHLASYLLLVVLLIHPHGLRISRYRVLAAFGALLLWCVLGLVWSTDRLSGIVSILCMTAFPALVVCFHRAAHRPVDWLRVGFFGAMLATGATWFSMVQADYEINANAWSLVPIAGIFGLYVAATGSGSRFTRFHALAAFVLCLACVVGLVASKSRGGMVLGALLAVALTIEMVKAHRSFALLWPAMLSCTGLLLSGSEIADGALARWRKAFDPTLEARQRTSYRSELARAGLTIGVENPGLGVGTGGFGTAQYSQSPRLGLRSGHAAAHSAWVKVLAENGLPGLVLLLGFVASYAVLGRRGRRRRLGLVTVVFLSTAMLWTQFASKVLWMTAAFAAVAVCGREPECDEGRRP